MERRVFIAILLCFVVLYGYQAFIGKPTPTPATTPTGTGQVAGVAAVAASLAPEVAATAAIAPDQTLLGDVVERDLRVETRDVVALFTNRGGRLKSWKLKHYLDRRGDPLDLIAVDLAATQPLPFSLRAADDRTTTALNSALYTVRGAPEGAGPVTAPTTLTFEYRSSTGLTSLKEFRIDPSTFTLGFRYAVSSGGQIIVPAVVWGPGLGDTDSQTGRYAVKPEAIHSIAGKISRIASSGILKQPSYQQDFDYAGIDDHYFIAVALKPGAATVTYTPLAIPALVGTKDAARELMGYSITPARTDQPLTFYIGPSSRAHSRVGASIAL